MNPKPSDTPESLLRSLWLAEKSLDAAHEMVELKEGVIYDLKDKLRALNLPESGNAFVLMDAFSDPKLYFLQRTALSMSVEPVPFLLANRLEWDPTLVLAQEAEAPSPDEALKAAAGFWINPACEFGTFAREPEGSDRVTPETIL